MPTKQRLVRSWRVKFTLKLQMCPPESVQFTSRELVTNQDDLAVVYSNFKGGGSCQGNPGEKETLLVDKSVANNQSYGVHSNKYDTSQFDGIKIRMTNAMGAGGNLASPFAQVLNFSKAEIPVDKVPNWIIVLDTRGLALNGGLNPHSTTSRYLVLARNGASIETKMFHLHTKLVQQPFLDQLRIHTVYSYPNNELKFCKGILRCDGSASQMKAIQGMSALHGK